MGMGAGTVWLVAVRAGEHVAGKRVPEVEADQQARALGLSANATFVEIHDGECGLGFTGRRPCACPRIKEVHP